MEVMHRVLLGLEQKRIRVKVPRVFGSLQLSLAKVLLLSLFCLLSYGFKLGKAFVAISKCLGFLEWF